MDELTNRLNILAESKVITHKTKHKIIDMIYYLNSKYELVLNETNASTFIMHLAMAITRIERGEGFEQVAGAMADEIQREKNFENAKVIADDIEQNIFHLAFPLQEKYFVITNLLVVMDDG